MSDGKSRCLINFLVNNPQGTWFLKSVDASASIKNRDLLYGHLDDVIQEIGEENVVQVISDNASNYKNVGAKLMERKEKVWWTPCAAHCIDLMLEDISKMAWFDDTLKRARCISKYLYGHQWGVLPLVCVLREVDSEERPPMGFIYELMDAAKEKIASNLNKVEKKYMPIWRKIDCRWDDQLHQPLHAAGYYLNPQFQYEDNFSDTDEVRNGLFACMDRMLGKGKEREDADVQ
ncbi:uncharacterized protein LOC125480394 [Pyrus x bretschneideri]|uniref:uncharacterized protein LOC125480394 n=1 Tax=Pyrus x bretschneideri TaxID=225117 RepID=UPI00202F9F07|nr:uncharacterized protein LOC125480394 [Pyrus x bretschneideri]